MVKKGNLNRAPYGCFSKIYRLWIYDLLLEIKCYVVRENLVDDSDQFAGTVPEGIVMGPAFRHLGIVVGLKGGVVFHYVVSSVHKCIPQDF